VPRICLVANTNNFKGAAMYEAAQTAMWPANIVAARKGPAK